jgi:hypothetical protein
MVTVQSVYRTSDLPITGPTSLPTALTRSTEEEKKKKKKKKKKRIVLTFSFM